MNCFCTFSFLFLLPYVWNFVSSEDVVSAPLPTSPEAIFNSDKITNSSVSKPNVPMRQTGIVVHDGSSFDMEMTKRPKVNYTVDEIRGRTLKIVGIIEQPFVNYFNFTTEAYEAHNKTGPGIVMDILREIGAKLDLKYEFVENGENMWGSRVNGNWTGLIGMLQRKEADILAGATIIRWDRHEVLDFPYSFHGSETGMMIFSPDQNVDNTFLIVTAPFSVQVWLVTLGAIIASGLIFKAFCKALDSTSEVQYSTLGSVWVFFSVFVQQGLPVQPKSWTCRTMLAFWWLGALTLVATFTGNMVALFAVSRSSLPFKTQEEMVEKIQYGNYKIVMTNTSDTRILFIKNSELELFKNLWYEMNSRQKWINVSTLDEGVKEVISKKSVILLGPKETLNVLSASDCKVTTLDKGLIPVWYSIGLQKNSPYTEVFSNEIQILVENGFIAKWLNDYQFKLSSSRGRRCVFSEGVSAAGQPITKDKAQGAFWILIAGLCMGFAAFFYEGLCRMGKSILIKLRLLSKETELNKSATVYETKQVGGPSQFASSNFETGESKYMESVNSYRPSGFVTNIPLKAVEETQNHQGMSSVKWRKRTIMRF